MWHICSNIYVVVGAAEGEIQSPKRHNRTEKVMKQMPGSIIYRVAIRLINYLIKSINSSSLKQNK